MEFLNVITAKKTYANEFKKDLKPSFSCLNKKAMDDMVKAQPLTTKVAVKLLLEGTLKSKVCRYCLNITPGLSELDQIMKIGGIGNIYKVTIRDIVASFHPFKVTEDPNFPDKICQKCVDKALSAYLFTQQCERAERAMLNCFDDMYEKFEKLDPIDRPKKRGRQKLNPNHNILHAEHNRVMDYAEPIINIVNLGSETFTKEPELNDLECKKCWQVLPNLESLMNHEKIHPKTMWYHCRLCGKSFPKRNQLKKHNNRVHVLGKELVPTATKDFKCKECSHVTDNFTQHLQHVEKHKFKNIMQHLIEKRMDKLCVVCFDKGTKMVELDKMVCIHGCHPDLMGDKTLYTLLATTLPNPKSYKYQDLCIPSKAQMMTISKRQNTHDDVSYTVKPDKNCNSVKEDFIFSNPIIISKDSLNTYNFYCYVFSDPEYLKDDDVGCKFIKKVQDLHETKPKIVEVVDIYEFKNDSEDKNTTMAEQIDSDFNALEVNGTSRVFSCNPDLVDHESMKNDTCDMEVVEENVSLVHKFSCPELVTDNNVINVLGIVPQYTFSNPNYEVTQFEMKERNTNKIHDNGLNKHLVQNSWIFDKIHNENKNHTTVKCKFVGWIFKHTGICDYNEASSKEVENNNNTTNDCKDMKAPNENKKDFNQRKNKIWECSVCLVINADRLTCQCCGNTRFAEQDVKIKFGHHKTFRATEPDNNFTVLTENYNIDPLNNEQNKIAIIEEVSIMDYKSNSDDNNNETNTNIETESTNINSMDIEASTFKTLSVGITNKDEVEAMDVEETPSVSNGGFNWNTSPVLNFNIEPVKISKVVLPEVKTPFTDANLQFHIGSPAEPKPQRKLKRVKKYGRGFDM